MLLGSVEHYKRIVMNVEQELILLCMPSNVNAMMKAVELQEANGVLELHKIHWKLPYVQVANLYRLTLLDVLNKGR